jgi:hypothetical protein
VVRLEELFFSIYSFTQYITPEQEFPGHGRFEGRVVDFDGNKCYEVHYPQDGDEEVMYKSELEKLDIILDAANES